MTNTVETKPENLQIQEMQKKLDEMEEKLKEKDEIIGRLEKENAELRAGVDTQKLARDVEKTASNEDINIDNLSIKTKFRKATIDKQEVKNVLNELKDPYKSEIRDFINKVDVEWLQKYLNGLIDNWKVDKIKLWEELTALEIWLDNGWHILEDWKFWPQTLWVIKVLNQTSEGEKKKDDEEEYEKKEEKKEKIEWVKVKEWEKELPKDKEVTAEDLVEAPDWATMEIEGDGVDKEKEWQKQEVTVIVKLGDKEQKVTVIVIIKNGEIKTEEKKDDEKRAENEGKNEEQKGLEDVNVKQEIALPENGKEVDARDLVEIPEEAIKWDEEITVGFKDEKWIDLESEDEQEVTVVAKLWDEEKEITIIVSVDAENRKIKAKEKK